MMPDRLRVLYLVGIAVLVFLPIPWWSVVALGVAQIAACLAVGVERPRMVAAVRKLAVLGTFLVVTEVLLGAPLDAPALQLGPLRVRYDLAGVARGLLMVARILVVVYASQAVRASLTAERWLNALRGLGAPRLIALTFDLTLELLEGDMGGGRGHGGGGGRGRGNGGGGGGGGGRGRGGGGGRGRGGGGGGGGRGRGDGRGRESHASMPGREEPPSDETVEAPRSRLQILRDFARTVRERRSEVLVEPLERSLRRARRTLVDRHPDLDEDLAADVAVVAGVATVMLSLKWIKTLPGVPVAPGHKNIVMLPLFLLAADRTRTPFGATATGVTLGALSFMVGDGRYGVFEMFKHITPGVFADLFRLVDFLGRSVPALVFIGLVLGVARFSAEVLIVLLLQPSPAIWAWIGVTAWTHLVASALSGVVSAAVLAAFSRNR